MRSARLAATNDPDYLMPADVFKKPSWEPSTPPPVIPQTLQSSVPPTPTETTNAASSSSDEDDMFLISASTSVSRPPAPTTHPSALRSTASPQTHTRPPLTTLTTPVDDRNILFWRDRMTAQEEERNQKGFRPAFLTDEANKPAFYASVNEVAPHLPEESTESATSDQQELPSEDREMAAVSNEPDTLLVPVVPLQSATTKQPAVSDIQVLFWRDRMNEQEEERNRHGFRKPFAENTETEVKDLPVNEFYVAGEEEEGEEVPSIPENVSVEAIASAFDESNRHADETVFEASEESELSSEPDEMIASMSEVEVDEVSEIAALVVEDSISQSSLMETDIEVDASEDSDDESELSWEPVETTPMSESNEEDEIASAVVVQSVSEPALVETDDELDTSGDEPELSWEPVSITSMPETDQIDEIAASVTEDSVSKPVLVATSNINGSNDVADSEDEAEPVSAETNPTDTIAGFEEVKPASDPAQITSIPESDQIDQIKADVAADSFPPPPVSNTPTAVAAEPVDAKSSTKELLQYLFTGSPEGSDEITDGKVVQYLDDPLSVITKVTTAVNGEEYRVHNGRSNGSTEIDDSFPIEQAKNADEAVENMASPVNDKGDVSKPSTDELLDILFGVNEKESTGDNESRRNSASEKLNGASLKNGTVKESEKREKEKLTSSKIREMALFTLKELLLQDRQ